LETRQLLSATISSAISPVLAHPSQPSNDSIDLSTHFNDPAVPGTLVQFDTSLGSFEVALTDAATPLTVQNFLNYVNSGAYNKTVIHRNALLTSSGGGGSPSAPADIVQGGGYIVQGDQLNHIPTAAPINNEVATETEGNVAGTIAMAKTSDPNSATSEWFFNVHDNSTALDDTSNSGGFTTFGHVLGDGMNIVDALAALPTVNLNSTFTTIPVVGISEKRATKTNTIVRANNLTYVKKISVLGDMTWTATSDNPFLVQPKVVGKNLSFSYAAGATGVADITVTATSADGASTISQTFAVTVPDTTKPSQGPTAVNDAPANVSAGTATILHPLANDTDSTAALSPSTLAIATQPAHGTAAVDTSTGYITYTPTAGFTGPDSFTYTIKDTAGHASSPATVSFTVAAAPVQVTLGKGHARQLTYTEPDGTVARLNVGGGTALITFAGSAVQTTTQGGTITATGADATISSIVITNANHQNASLRLTASGGTDGLASIGSLTDAGSMSAINAPGAALAGNLTVDGVGRLNLASTDHSVLTIGNGVGQTALVLANAADTNVVADSVLTSVRSKQWTNTTGVDESISAPRIGTLTTTGDFADSLNLSGQVNRIRSGGNVTGNLTAATIGRMNVGGNLSATIQTTASFAKHSLQIGAMNVRGAITGSTINANGNIGTISAASMSGSNIYAGVDATTTADHALPLAASNFTADARIDAVRLGGGNPAFSDSRIAANELRSLHFGLIEPTNGGASQGVAGQVIDRLTGQLTTGAKLSLGRAKLKDATTLSAFLTSKSITLGDFAIDIL
jgi:cyclophilin family peptidyl-prolyl cis-trans isomerase